MGEHTNVGYDTFPIQGKALGREVDVIQKLSDGTEARLVGTVVRDDLEDPLVTMITLGDGDVVLGTESAGYTPVEQGSYKGKRVSVCFNYDTSMQIEGTIRRNDMEEPQLTVIALDTGRFVLSTECMYQPPK